MLRVHCHLCDVSLYCVSGKCCDYLDWFSGNIIAFVSEQWASKQFPVIFVE